MSRRKALCHLFARASSRGRPIRVRGDGAPVDGAVLHPVAPARELRQGAPRQRRAHLSPAPQVTNAGPGAEMDPGQGPRAERSLVGELRNNCGRVSIHLDSVSRMFRTDLQRHPATAVVPIPYESYLRLRKKKRHETTYSYYSPRKAATRTEFPGTTAQIWAHGTEKKKADRTRSASGLSTTVAPPWRSTRLPTSINTGMTFNGFFRWYLNKQSLYHLYSLNSASLYSGVPLPNLGLPNTSSPPTTVAWADAQ